MVLRDAALQQVRFKLKILSVKGVFTKENIRIICLKAGVFTNGLTTVPMREILSKANRLVVFDTKNL